MMKEQYISAMKKITMRDECTGIILDSINDIPQEHSATKNSKVRYISILTAAAVLICSTVSVAAKSGGFDWLKYLFGQGIETTDIIEDMGGEISDFRCESSVGLELSPVGAIIDEQNLYCAFNIKSLPEGINTSDLSVYFLHDASDSSPAVGAWESFVSTADDNDNIIAVSISTHDDTEIFQNDKTITFGIFSIREFDKLYNNDNEGISEQEANAYRMSTKLSFKVSGCKLHNLDIDYSKYTCESTPERTGDFMFDNLHITPFNILAQGHRVSYADVMHNDDITIVFEDGSKATAHSNGYSTCSNSSPSFSDNNTTLEERLDNLSKYEYQHFTEWTLDKPIDPEKITDIYIGNMKIYSK